MLDPNASFFPLEILPEDLLDEARASWAAWAPAREVGPDVAFEAMVGRPRDQLPELAAAPGCELLVVGARGEDGRRGGVGPVASACVQRSTTPVLVVRERQVDRFAIVAACVDFTETCARAVDLAIRFAARDDAALHVLHVYADPWRGRPLPANLLANMPDARERYRRAVEDRLRAFCSPWQHEFHALKPHFRTECSDRPGRGLAELLTQSRADLGVLGARTRWNLRDAVWGSTAERIVRDATCAVLAVHPIKSAV
jgi:nucleotide-binding universal stress UspA family protein